METKATAPLKESAKTYISFLGAFKKLYREATGFTYAIKPSKATKMFKDIQEITPEDLNVIFGKFFAWWKQDDFWSKKLPELEILLSQINKVIAYSGENTGFKYKKLGGK